MGSRPSRGKAFRLTVERKTILEQLVRYRYLRTSHFYQLRCVGQEVSDRAVRRLLRDFWRHGHLRRRIVVADIGRSPVPRFENVYWLSPAGVRLARDCGLCDDTFPERPQRGFRTLEHDAAITDVHLGVERFARAHGWPLYWQQHGLKRGVNPDALFALTDPRGPSIANTAYYFLEVERSRLGGYRDGRSVLLRRLHRYADYQASAACRRDWQWFDEFRVVIVVASEARRRNLLARLSDELPHPMFWVAVEGSDFGTAVFSAPGTPDSRAYSLRD